MGLRIDPHPRTGILQISGSIAGQRVRRSAQTRDPDIARQVAHAIEGRLWKRRLHGDEAVATFEEAALAYMKDGGERRFLDPLIVQFKGRLVAGIKPAEIRAAARKIYPGAGPATLNRQGIAPARAVINFAHQQGWCPPIRVAQFRTRPPQRTAVDADWIMAFRAAAFSGRLPYLAAAARFMFEGGTRIGEVCEVRPGDCNLQARRILLVDTKNGEDYAVTISTGMAAELASLPPRRGRVFGYRSRRHVYKVWRNTCRRAGIPYVPPHQAGRHSFATTLDAEGWTASQIAEAGRWKSVRLVAETYVHPRDSSRRAADLIGDKLTIADESKVVSADAKRRNHK